MKNYLSLLLLASVFLGCRSVDDLNIEPGKVVETLTAYGQENPETRAIVHTRKGDIEIRLYTETPLHRANFVRLVKAGYYDERDFYRIVPGVVLQGGGETRDQLNYTVPAEFRPNLLNKKGALSMARYSDNNPNKESSATEFFFVTKGRFYNTDDLARYPEAQRQVYLNPGGEMLFDNEYTVFGEVTKGLDVVETIGKMPVVEQEKPYDRVKFSIELLK
jgi:cyclophilin family peptidyl-prolyl cis-trans isomerase